VVDVVLLLDAVEELDGFVELVVATLEVLELLLLELVVVLLDESVLDEDDSLVVILVSSIDEIEVFSSLLVDAGPNGNLIAHDANRNGVTTNNNFFFIRSLF
jgi:hypothetical protein